MHAENRKIIRVSLSFINRTTKCYIAQWSTIKNVTATNSSVYFLLASNFVQKHF